MLTRNRSKSVCSDESLSQGSHSLSREISNVSVSSSTFVDSQDSAPLSLITEDRERKPSSIKHAHHLSSSQWVVILPRDALGDNNVQPQFIKYPDPHSGILRQYLISADQRRIYELNKTSSQYRSWFIGESVQSDGSFYVCTKMDPLFFILAALLSSKSIDKFTTLDAILDHCSHSYLIENLVSPTQMSNITDSKVIQGDVIVYRYNKEKTLCWLSKKVELLSSTLKEQGIYVGKGSQSVHYVRSNKQTSLAEDEEYKEYASGMIKDYVPASLCEDLDAKYQLAAVDRKRPIEDGNELPAKKRQISEPTEDYSKGVKPVAVKVEPKLSAAQKALAKVNKKGMKTMTSFFTKK
ncbi:PREDICTED: ribonuclease H2 subunit B-like [Amphimedon queenslandica]|uniref:Ribonuclease H2 subunit B n=1 Tax=Amphimedon queenslandica TaxID=400682 RepID=A0A1X7VMJ3_AMPQE|nr:PREDICTED: ribonuclease H2 subunit B-like [Amphimedon queenslandica]|eukprot:XP_011409827.1 PREDICTED: ribonuclease H2 subunit B-like [Amphimedon queenslandica]